MTPRRRFASDAIRRLAWSLSGAAWSTAINGGIAADLSDLMSALLIHIQQFELDRLSARFILLMLL